MTSFKRETLRVCREADRALRRYHRKLVADANEALELFRSLFGGEKARVKGGFRRIGDPKPEQPEAWLGKLCRHPEHNPPGNIVLQHGRYEYTCPGCGSVTVVTVPEVRW